MESWEESRVQLIIIITSSQQKSDERPHQRGPTHGSYWCPSHCMQSWMLSAIIKWWSSIGCRQHLAMVYVPWQNFQVENSGKSSKGKYSCFWRNPNFFKIQCRISREKPQAKNQLDLCSCLDTIPACDRHQVRGPQLLLCQHNTAWAKKLSALICLHITIIFPKWGQNFHEIRLRVDCLIQAILPQKPIKTP